MLMIPPCTFLSLSTDDQPFRKYTARAGKPRMGQIGAKQTMCCSMPQKLNSSTYQLDTTFQITIPSSSMTLNCSPSPTLNILGLSFTCNLNWKLHISLAKTASMKLGVLSRLCQFYSPPQLLTLYRGFILPYMEYASHVWGGFTH